MLIDAKIASNLFMLQLVTNGKLCLKRQNVQPARAHIRFMLEDHIQGLVPELLSLTRSKHRRKNICLARHEQIQKKPQNKLLKILMLISELMLFFGSFLFLRYRQEYKNILRRIKSLVDSTGNYKINGNFQQRKVNFYEVSDYFPREIFTRK